MADPTTTLLPNLTTATNQGKVYWESFGGGYRSTVLHWTLFMTRVDAIVTLAINSDTGRGIFSGDLDNAQARNLWDAAVAQTDLPDDVALTQFVGVVGAL